MVLLRGKTLVKCPKLNEEVSVQNKCVQCPDFKHVGHESYAILIVACKHGETDEPEKKKIDVVEAMDRLERRESLDEGKKGAEEFEEEG